VRKTICTICPLARLAMGTVTFEIKLCNWASAPFIACSSLGKCRGSFSLKLREMDSLKVQRPGIASIGHENIQNRQRLQSGVVSAPVSHGTVANFKQALQERPVLLGKRLGNFAQCLVRWIARSKRRPVLMNNQPTPRLMFSRSIPENAESSSSQRVSIAGYPRNCVSRQPRRVPQLPDEKRHIDR